MTNIQKIVKIFATISAYLQSLYTKIMDIIDFHWVHEAALVNHYIETSNNRVTHFIKSTNGSMSSGGMGIVSVIIGLVIAFRVFISIMPSVITDTKAVTADNGTGSGWDDSEKAMWSVISLLMIVFGIFIAMYAMRQRG